MSKSFDRAEALAICHQNLKGSKSKDLLLTARALQYLKSLRDFKSNQHVGEAVGVSGEMVRQFIGLLDLPLSVQSRLAQGELGLEHGRRLRQLGQDRPDVVDSAAETMTSMTAMDARDLVEYLIREPAASVDDSMAALNAAKQIVQNEYHIDTVLDETAFRRLSAHARHQGMRATDLASSIVNRWLEENDN
jgi:hypothetical protein